MKLLIQLWSAVIFVASLELMAQGLLSVGFFMLASAFWLFTSTYLKVPAKFEWIVDGFAAAILFLSLIVFLSCAYIWLTSGNVCEVITCP